MTKLTWNERKRETNLLKHGLDFLDAPLVLESEFRLDIESHRNGEARTQSFAYAFDVLMVLTVVYVASEDWRHIISFRPARRSEREVYYEWLESDFNDD